MIWTIWHRCLLLNDTFKTGESVIATLNFSYSFYVTWSFAVPVRKLILLLQILSATASFRPLMK